MEALSVSLQPYKDIVGSLASILTIAQFLAGSMICKDIYKSKSTVGVPATPFIGGLVIGILMLEYSLLLNDIPMLVVNVSAVLINLAYIFFYSAYSKDRSSEIYKPLSYGTTLVVVLISYTLVENADLLEFRFGIITTILMLSLMGSPLIELKAIIAKKDSSSIPFPITFSAFIVSFLWLLYGIILLNHFMVVQNVLGLLICGFQVVLCFTYPKGSVEAKKTD